MLMLNRLLPSVIGLISPIMLANVPNGGTYFFFAAFACVAFISTYFMVPETRLKSLEEMDEIFKAKSTHSEREIVASVHQELGLERPVSSDKAPVV